MLYGGEKENLHAIWDTNMLEQRVGGDGLADAARWSETLVQEIRNGSYAAARAGWVKGLELEDPEGSTAGVSGDANAFVCIEVLKGGVGAVQGKELSTEYYGAAVPVFEVQIAKAGVRLAAWLNLIVTNTTGLEDGVEAGGRYVRPVMVNDEL